MTVGAQHDGIDITRQHAGGIGNALAAAKLQITMVEHDRLAAKLAHGNVERHPGAGRRFFKDHSEHGISDARRLQTFRRPFTGFLEFMRRTDNRAEIIGRDASILRKWRGR